MIFMDDLVSGLRRQCGIFTSSDNNKAVRNDGFCIFIQRNLRFGSEEQEARSSLKPLVVFLSCFSLLAPKAKPQVT
tara:strand:- start:1330 stop:1557 length:228 start_codon:yes stop_codon:yes gene_type:complete